MYRPNWSTSEIDAPPSGAEPFEQPDDISNVRLLGEATSERTIIIYVLPASRWRNLGWFILIFAVTFTWVILLITYTLLSSVLSIPFKIFQTPTRAILAINLGSTVATVLLAALVNESFEILRWRLATQRYGTGIATFLALGHATNMLSVIKLLFSSQNVGHEKWCIQRFHMRK